MSKNIFLFLLILFSTWSHAKSPDLSTMTDEEKQSTGLNKLSDEELKSLSSWLRNEQLKIEKKTRSRNAGFEARQQNKRTKIKAGLKKSFVDKLGRTFYELDNGQIWKSVSSGSVIFKDQNRKIISIEPAALGSWRMSGDGNRSVKVKRVK